MTREKWAAMPEAIIVENCPGCHGHPFADCDIGASPCKLCQPRHIDVYRSEYGCRYFLIDPIPDHKFYCPWIRAIRLGKRRYLTWVDPQKITKE